MKGDSGGDVLGKVDCGQWEILGPLSGGRFRERGGFWLRALKRRVLGGGNLKRKEILVKGRFWGKGSKRIINILGENSRRRWVLNPESGNPGISCCGFRR